MSMPRVPTAGPPNGYDCGRVTESRTLLVWSGADKAAAEKLSTAYSTYVAQHSGNLSDLAYTLSTKRSVLQWRSFAVVDPRNKAQLSVSLTDPVKARDDAQVAFMSQYVGMGRELFIFAVFRDSIDSMDSCLQRLGCSWSLREVLERGAGDTATDSPEYSQVLTTAL
ncbi:hypothetical protein BDW62DRAFT_127230 [Aspergillus aurantiobrunneus]